MIRAVLKAVLGFFQTKHTGIVVPPRGYVKVCTICRKRSIECLLVFAQTGLSCCPSCDHRSGLDGEKLRINVRGSLFWQWEHGSRRLQLMASDGITPPLLLCVGDSKAYLIVDPRTADMDGALDWLRGGEACLKGTMEAIEAG